MVIVKSENEEKETHLTNINAEAENWKGKAMLVILTDLALQLFNTQISESKKMDKGPRVRSSKKNKQSQKKKCEEKQDSKLPPMRTASDVIHRIMWDTQLRKEHFNVGYVDRFVGVVEKCFTEFSWEDIASVDFNTLAIPKHRINYFKYNGVKVWDKHERLDNVFGSTGSGLTITDVLHSANVTKTAKEEDAWTKSVSEANDLSKSNQISTSTEIPVSQDLAQLTLKEKSPFNNSRSKSATHFLCFRIDDTEIQFNVQKVHSYVEEEMPTYVRLFVPTSKLHVTLLALNLDSPDKLEHVTNVLLSEKAQIISSMSDLTLDLNRIKVHCNRVIYVPVQSDPKLIKLQTTLQQKLNAFIDSRDEDVAPHMTLLKLRHSDQRDLDIQSLNSVVFQRIENAKFGKQSVSALHLCEMSSPSKHRFYNIVTSI